MVDEKLTEVEETEIAEEAITQEVMEEEIMEETVNEEACPEDALCENEAIEEECVEEVLEEDCNEKKSSNKGLIINAVLTGIMLVALIANSVLTIINFNKMRALESDFADAKEVLSYALTGDASQTFDFAETADKIREERKMLEELMKEMETQQEN